MTTAWLTDDEQALVGTTLATGGEAARSWARFTELVDLDDIWDERGALLPACHVALGDREGLPERPRLVGTHRRSWAAQQTAMAEATEALALLGDGGVGACLHGDLAVALTLHPDPAARVADLAEVLLPVDDLALALELLADGGWRPVDPRPLDPLVPHVDSTLVAGPDRPRMRLAWETCRGVADSRADRASVAAVVADAVAITTDHGDLPVIPPDAAAVHALCAGVGSVPGHRLRAVCDTALALREPAGTGRRTVALDALVDRVAGLGVATVAAHVAGVTEGIAGVGGDLVPRVSDLPVTARDQRLHRRLIRTAAPGARRRPPAADWDRRTVGLGWGEAARTAGPFLAARWGLASATMVPIEAIRRTAARAGRARP